MDLLRKGMKKLKVAPKKKKVPFAEAIARELWHIEHWDKAKKHFPNSQVAFDRARRKETWFRSEEIPAELMYDKFIYE
jgi:hypothetical protein